MKTLKSINGLFILIALLLQTGLANADEVERTLAQKKFDVNKNALLSVEHKFGKLKCTNWDQEAISVKVTALVRATNTEKANKLLDKISIEMDGNRNEVSVESDFNEKLFKGNKNELTIDIEIMIPESVRLDIDHQFGNAYIEKVSGESNITIQYGSIEINALSSENNDVEVSFSEARIDYLGSADLDISYSTATIGEALELNIDSDYSTVSISSVQQLEIENEGGNVTVDDAETVELASNFSEFKIGSLSKMLIADTEYGSLKVKNISAGFSEISIENSFGSSTLDFEKGASFSLEAKMEFCDLVYPESQARFSERIIEPTEKYYRGTFGDGNAKSTVTIESSFGNVSIDM
jgi:hypothetical protein